jgi:hypothetical protein
VCFHQQTLAFSLPGEGGFLVDAEARDVANGNGISAFVSCGLTVV